MSSISVSVIVRRNALHNVINDRKLRLMSDMTETSITYYIADVMKRNEMSIFEIKKIKSENNDAIDNEILDLLSEASLMINKNINQSLDMFFYIYDQLLTSVRNHQ